MTDTALTKVVNGVVVQLSDQEAADIEAEWAANAAAQAAIQWRVDRINSYPCIGDQLDYLWHAMDNGEIPKCTAFYDAINTVKKTYPKPT